MHIDDDPRANATAHAIHEINNALAGIQYSFLLIKDAIPAEHPNRSSVTAIERSIARIAAITRELHDAYLPQNGA